MSKCKKDKNIHARPNNARPRIPIDWKMVDEYLEAGCSGSEIASLVGLTAETLYERCVKEHGITYSIYSHERKQKGDSCLRKVQYDLAKAGDKTMLVWLGKNRLKQTDKSDVKVNDNEADVRKLLAIWESSQNKNSNE